MQFDEMRRRQHAIASSRNRQSNNSSRSSRGGNNILTKMTGTTRKKFSLLLPQITAPSPHYPRHEYETSPVCRGGGGGRGRWWTTTPWSLKCIFVLLAPFLLLISYYSGRYSQQQRLGAGVSETTTSTVRGKYWRSANVLLESSNNTNNTALPQLIAGGMSSNDDDLIYNENDEAADEEQQTMPNDYNTIDIDNQEEEGGVTVVVKNEGEMSKNENGSSSTVVVVKNNKNESSFKYVGTLDSTIPNPWPNTEIDWWYMHNKLVSRVQLSDNDNTNYNLQEKKKDEEEEQEQEEEEEKEEEEEDEQKMIILPQLIFIGDSITEGWEGTSLGQIPQGTRGWGDDPTNEIHAIRTIFDTNFGTTSNYWGKYTWKLPLVLGIGGSRTDDLLWRLANGEFPTSVRRQQRQQLQQQQQQQRSKIMDGKDDNVVSTTADTKEIMENESDVQHAEENDDEVYKEEDEEEDNEIEVNIADNNPHRKMETPTKTMKEQTHDTKTFQVDQLERIYIVLIGTNNLGGGMTPHQTIRGIDAVGRMIYKLHRENYYTAISSSSISNSTNELLDALTPPPPVAIVLSELLPRYDSQRAIKMCPPKCKNNITLEPYTTFMPEIDAVNRALPDVVDGWRKDFINSRIVLLSSSINMDEDVGNGDYDSNSSSSSSRSSQKNESNDNDGAASDVVKNDYTHRIECGREMFIFDDESEFEIYMPDRLHPNAKGYELWLNCLLKGLAAIVA